jgi:hypothetical protein
MHCDISDGNILIYKGHGILVDWEFAQKVDEKGRVIIIKHNEGGQPVSGGHLIHRAGTWFFVGVTSHVCMCVADDRCR